MHAWSSPARDIPERRLRRVGEEGQRGPGRQMLSWRETGGRPGSVRPLPHWSASLGADESRWPAFWAPAHHVEGVVEPPASLERDPVPGGRSRVVEPPPPTPRARSRGPRSDPESRCENDLDEGRVVRGNERGGPARPPTPVPRRRSEGTSNGARSSLTEEDDGCGFSESPEEDLEQVREQLTRLVSRHAPPPAKGLPRARARVTAPPALASGEPESPTQTTPVTRGSGETHAWHLPLSPATPVSLALPRPVPLHGQGGPSPTADGGAAAPGGGGARGGGAP